MNFFSHYFRRSISNGRIRESQLILDRITGYKRRRRTRNRKSRKPVQKVDDALHHQSNSAAHDADDEDDDILQLQKECQALCRINVFEDLDSGEDDMDLNDK